MSVEETTRAGVRSEASRTRILRAAAEIAAENGYERTTIKKITERSGLPASSVYWFFRDKDHLLAEVVQNSFEEWAAVQPTWGTPDPEHVPVGEALRGILGKATRSLLATPDFMRIGLMFLLQNRQEEGFDGRRVYLEQRRGIEDQIARWFDAYLTDEHRRDRPGLDRDLARLVIAATDGLFLADQFLRQGDTDDFVEMVVAAVESAVREA